MKVFKFGGASVKDSDGIMNLAEIVSCEKGKLVIVVSALGKTTNALEKVLSEWMGDNVSYLQTLDEIRNFHLSVVNGLFQGKSTVQNELESSFGKLKIYLSAPKTNGYDFRYDQVVSYGEVWSTIIVSGYLKVHSDDVEWVDIRKLLVTDERYRDANILWNESSERIKRALSFREKRIYVTQGFIGGTLIGYSTTLGREGSDFTAAILANILDAESVSVWKDVPGILNSDPKWLEDTVKLDEISYREAVEMTFSGAKVIHPKTIKPLHNKQIPLYVKSFLMPGEEGTIIKSDPVIKEKIPVFIKKELQILISILPLDFSFVMGDNLSRIFKYFTDHGIKVNLVEASAISIDVCVNDERERVNAFMQDLKPEFSITYNENVEMLTVRHYNDEAVKRITTGREILIQQWTRSTVRFVVKSLQSP